MIKILIGVVLMCVAGGAWLYLDCLNHHEQGETAALQQGMLQAKAEARRRADTRTLFEVQLQDSLKACMDAADKSKADYMALLQKNLPSKRGVVVVPQAALDEAEALMTSARAACQQNHDEKMKHLP